MAEGFIMDPKIMIQIVSIAVAMGGAWALVKSSLKTAQRDLEDLAGRLKELGTDLHKRVDIIEQDKSVIQRQVAIFADILSPKELKALNREMGMLLSKVESLEKDLKNLSIKYEKSHNGTHPPTGVKKNE